MKVLTCVVLAGLALSFAGASEAAQAPAAKAAAPAAGDTARGETLFKQRCAICHSLVVDTTKRPGPSLKGVANRKAGTVAGFTYSPAMKNSSVTWTKANLDQYLVSPPKMFPGGFMVMMVPNAKDRADLVAYLGTLTK